MSSSMFLKDNLDLSWCGTLRLHSDVRKQDLVAFFLIRKSNVLET